jgi:RNA polymerase sigma-70 factor (ECF subfamily)
VISYDQVLLPGEDEAASIEYAAPTSTPVQQLAGDEEKAALRAALERLTEPHRIVFELAVYQELPYQEISALLDIPVGTVKSRMHNATLALKQLLARPAVGEVRTRRSGGAG